MGCGRKYEITGRATIAAKHISLLCRAIILRNFLLNLFTILLSMGVRHVGQVAEFAAMALHLLTQF